MLYILTLESTFFNGKSMWKPGIALFRKAKFDQLAAGRKTTLKRLFVNYTL